MPTKERLPADQAKAYSKWFVFITKIFITCLITANITAVKLIYVFGFVLPAAIVIFPLIYIISDVLNEEYGYRQARMVIRLDYKGNLIVIIAIWLGHILPTASFWDGQLAYERNLGYTPRLLIASFLAYLVGELVEEKPVCCYLNEEPSTGLTGNEVLIRAEVCQEQHAKQAGQPGYTTGAGISDSSNNIHDLGITTATLSGGASALVSNPMQPLSGLTQLSLKFALPKGKVSSLMGVLNFLQSRYSHMQIILDVEQGHLTEQEFEGKIREAFRQMGVEIE